MFVFAHLGIGKKLASPWSRNLPPVPLFLGMLLPDIIDKFLYYGLDLMNARPEIVTGTRTFGHTGLFLFGVLLLAVALRSRWLSALSLGMATHLLLDCLSDRLSDTPTSSALQALTWPLFNGGRFASFPFPSLAAHLHHVATFPTLYFETLGLAILGWDYWKSRLIHLGARPRLWRWRARDKRR